MRKIGKRKTYEEVRQIFEDYGFKLISETYQNNKQRLSYICPKHPLEIQTTRLNDLQSGHGCRSCGMESSIANMRKLAEGQKHNYEDIKREVESAGFKLVSDEYINAQTHLEVICPNHPNDIIRARINDFRVGVHRCAQCAVESRKIPFEQVLTMFASKGYTLLESNYENSRTLMKYTCPNHPDKDTRITYDSLRGGHECFFCATDKLRGENSPHYNHNVSDEDRARDRRYDAEHHRWRVQVFIRDNYTCAACNTFNRNNINAHHMDSHHWCIERRHDITNGVTLCKECHKQFHTEYGYRNNTEAQFNEWIAKILLNETEG